MSIPPDAATAASAPLRLWQATLHLVGLWAVVMGQPILEQLARNPEFFAAHRSDGTDVIVLALLLLFAPPLVVSLLAGVLAAGRPHWLSRLVSLLVGLLIAAFVIQVVHRLAVEWWPVSLTIAVAVVAVASAAYMRRPAMRLFLMVLAPAPVVVLAVFIQGFGVDSLGEWNDMQAASADHVAAAPSLSSDARNHHVAVLVFDEVPLTSIMSEAGGIDGERFPNLAALAADGIWYRNASTVADFTRYAVPAILSGRYPPPGASPIPASYPDTIFTMLGDTHRVVASEPLTRLCPNSICGGPELSRPSRLRNMAADLGVLGLHVLAPRDLAAQLPPLDAGWAGFAAAAAPDAQPLPVWQRLWLAGAELDPMREVEAFIDRVGLAPADPRPALFFMHTIVSHSPYHYLPSGHRLSSQIRPASFSLESGMSNQSVWALRQRYQKHLLQVGMVDMLVGRFIQRLKNAGMYDDTLIVVTADHGVSFRPNLPYRILSAETAPDIVPVPLILKPAAGANVARGVVDDANVQAIDLVPTIADLMNRPLGWAADGMTAMDPGSSRPDDKTVYWDGSTQTMSFPAEEMAVRRDEAVARKVEMVGRAAFPMPVPDELAWLLGRDVQTLDVSQDPDGWECWLDDPSWFDRVDFDSGVLPAQVAGTLTPRERAVRTPVALAVAINGRVAAVTWTWEETPDWLVVFDPAILRPGRNQLDVFVVDPSGSRLHRVAGR